MTTKYEIPTYIRNKDKSLPSLEEKERHHAIGYSEQSLDIIATKIRAAAGTYLEDITSRKLLATDVTYALSSIDEAIALLRASMLRLHDIKDFVSTNLATPPDKK